MLHASLTTSAELLSSVNVMGAIIVENGLMSRVLHPYKIHCPDQNKNNPCQQMCQPRRKDMPRSLENICVDQACYKSG